MAETVGGLASAVHTQQRFSIGPDQVGSVSLFWVNGGPSLVFQTADRGKSQRSVAEGLKAAEGVAEVLPRAQTRNTLGINDLHWDKFILTPNLRQEK